MSIFAVKNSGVVSFRSDARKKQDGQTVNKIAYDKNPITKRGERSNTILATVGAGLVFGTRLLFALMDDDTGDGAKFVGEMAQKVSDKIQHKNGVKFGNSNKSFANKIGGPIAVIVGFVALMALVYTIYNMPKAMYNAKVNTFKKQKDMDVYIKGNAVEKELYNQMNERAKTADSEEKEKLKLQYAKLKAAKNVVPDFVKMK